MRLNIIAPPRHPHEFSVPLSFSSTEVAQLMMGMLWFDSSLSHIYISMFNTTVTLFNLVKLKKASMLATPRPQRSRRNLRMSETPAVQPRYPQFRLAIRIRACDLPIRRHPVICVSHSLFCCQQRQDRAYISSDQCPATSLVPLYIVHTQGID